MGIEPKDPGGIWITQKRSLRSLDAHAAGDETAAPWEN